MKFEIGRDTLLAPLGLVSGVVEKRQTLPVLGNVLLALEGDRLSLTGTDLEVELVGRAQVAGSEEGGETTVPARKLMDICRSLPEGSDIDFSTPEENRLMLASGRSRFTLATIPATNFPNIEDGIGTHQFRISQSRLKRVIHRTAFAMAQQDVRYYLNGMLWELSDQRLRMVATDGHRLAMCTTRSELRVEEEIGVIVPRKGILELARLLQDEGDVAVVLGSNHLRATTDAATFTSKLIDGKFPSYQKVLPPSPETTMSGPKDELRQAFSRTAILSNEKYHGVALQLSRNNLKVLASNPDQERAEETVSVSYEGPDLEIGFNVSYLLDVLSVLSGETAGLALSGTNSSLLIEESDDDDESVYVIMPMRL